jgi:hypothetical protein
MNKFTELVDYFFKKYPDINLSVYHEHIDSTVAEIEAFLKAWDLGFQSGYSNASKVAAEEYQRNIHEIVIATHATGYNQGFADGSEVGFDTGIDQELHASIIPSNAYNIEVFAVQPSHEFETGKQAFIGYKFLDGEDKEQFHFVQVQFAVPNLQTKSKINEKNNCDFQQAIGQKVS